MKRGCDRDRSDRVYARAHHEQRLHRHRRSPELRTYGQIKMMLTRLGWHLTMVVTGDPDQSDLLDGLSGLAEIARRLDPIAEIALVRVGDGDIVRHPLVADMLPVLCALSWLQTRVEPGLCPSLI